MAANIISQMTTTLLLTAETSLLAIYIKYFNFTECSDHKKCAMYCFGLICFAKLPILRKQATENKCQIFVSDHSSHKKYLTTNWGKEVYKQCYCWCSGYVEMKGHYRCWAMNLVENAYEDGMRLSRLRTGFADKLLCGESLGSRTARTNLIW
jgi:hypothetical protein